MRKALEKSVNKKLRTLMKGVDVERARMCIGTSFVYDKKGKGQKKMYDPDTGKALRKPCERRAIKGGFVCMTHGGSAPQIRKAANERLASLVDESVTRLHELSEQNSHLPTAFNATKEILASQKVLADPTAKGGEGGGKPTVIIGINFGKLGTTDSGKLVLGTGAFEAEVVDGEKA